MENRIEHLGYANGWSKEENLYFDKLYAMWKKEKDDGLDVRRDEENIGTCCTKYIYYFYDGSGFSYKIDSSD